jgi:N-acetylmuramoyl-L-alanine amidase
VTSTPYLKLDPSLERETVTLGGIQYVPLDRVCEVYKLDLQWDPYIKTAVIKRNGKIALREGGSNILVNGSIKRLDGPVASSGGELLVPVSFVRNDLGAIAVAPAYEAVPRREFVPQPRVPGIYAIKTVMIDPGHGGKDPGAIGRRYRMKEKYLALEISGKLKSILEDHGIRVIMTRTGDNFVPLPKRSRLANQSRADLFVSIHINASRSRSLRGFECYYLSDATDDNARAIEARENASLKFDDEAEYERSRGLDATLWDMTLSEARRESAELASHICGSVDSSLAAKARGVKTARFYVLKFTRIPAVLVETGYISNKYEEIKLKDSGYLDRMADAVARGILAYKDEYERTEGFTKR